METVNNRSFLDSQIISDLLYSNNTIEEQKDIYNNFRVFYEYLNWDDLKEENVRLVSLEDYVENRFDVESFVDVDCESLNVKKYNLQGNYLTVDDMIFKKFYKPINGKLYGLFRFITLYEILIVEEDVRLNRLFSRETINDGNIIIEKPVICYGKNFTRIENFDEEKGIRKVLAK